MNLLKLLEKYPELKPIINSIAEIDKISELYEPQALALGKGVLEGKNLVLSIPTASGKTLIAEIVMLKKVLEGKKAVYISPLKALASEKFDEFKLKYSELAKIGISTGDFDSNGSELGNFDILFVTIEKMDSLMRHSPEWLSKIGIAVLDEIHLIDSAERGPTLEIVTTKLKSLGTQLLALSATIENCDELAEWLNAELVESEFRPIKLSRGVFLKNEINFKEKENQQLVACGLEPSIALTTDIVKNNAQSLVFVSTRKGAEKEAEENSEEIYKLLSTKEKKELKLLSEKILEVLDSPTQQCKRLSNCVLKGTAFHHAGLHSKQRHLVEKNFKENLIKVICATPTLAAGVNLPAKRVVIRDWKRFATFGMEPLPVLEVCQMFGRAGRPKYDSEGEAVLIASSLAEYETLWSTYIEGRPEPISSKLGVEPILRMHILGLISQLPRTKEKILEFFSKTFYAYQYQNLEGIEKIIDVILDQLFEWHFVDYDKKHIFKCTPLGLRVAQLYIDPLTAHDFIELLSRKIPEDVVLLTILSDTAEMRPLAAVRSSEELEIYEQFEKYDLKEEQIRAFKNAIIFIEWMNEVTDDYIYDKYSMPPGTLRTKLQIADWLLYAYSEISRILGKEKIVPKINMLRKRLEYGVKAELLPLTRVRDIGRVRARKLFNAGIKNIEDLKKTEPKKLSVILSVKIAEKIAENLEIRFEKAEKERKGLEKYVE